MVECARDQQGAIPFICCWKEPGEEAYSSNLTFLFDSEVLLTSFRCSSFPGFMPAEQKDYEEKKFGPFVRFWEMATRFFGGVSGAACLSVGIYLSGRI